MKKLLALIMAVTIIALTTTNAFATAPTNSVTFSYALVHGVSSQNICQKACSCTTKCTEDITAVWLGTQSHISFRPYWNNHALLNAPRNFNSGETFDMVYDHNESYALPNNNETADEQPKSIEEMLELYYKTVEELDDLKDVFDMIPGFEATIKKTSTLEYLYSLTYDCTDSELDYLYVLIVYIENGYSITNIEELLSMSSMFTSITLTTRSGKQIYGLKLTGTDTATPYSGTYTGATPINNTQTYAYNCHSYAWYYGGNYNSSDKMWIDQPQPYASGLHCHNLLYSNKTISEISSSSVSAGDIIVYIMDQNDDQMVSPNTVLWAHSAIVDHVTSSGYIWVRSKWYCHQVFSHRIEHCPYYYGWINGVQYTRLLSVYHPKHSIDTSLVANQNYYPKNSSYHYKACYYCGRHITSSTEAHTFITVNGVTYCTKCGYNY